MNFDEQLHSLEIFWLALWKSGQKGVVGLDAGKDFSRGHLLPEKPIDNVSRCPRRWNEIVRSPEAEPLRAASVKCGVSSARFHSLATYLYKRAMLRMY